MAIVAELARYTSAGKLAARSRAMELILQISYVSLCHPNCKLCSRVQAKPWSLQQSPARGSAQVRGWQHDRHSGAGLWLWFSCCFFFL